MTETMTIPRTLFAVFGVKNPENLAPRIEESFDPEYVYKIAPGQWLIAAPATMTTKELSDKLGVTAEPSVSSALIMAVGAYFGRHDLALWEWIPAKTAQRANVGS